MPSKTQAGEPPAPKQGGPQPQSAKAPSPPPAVKASPPKPAASAGPPPKSVAQSAAAAPPGAPPRAAPPASAPKPPSPPATGRPAAPGGVPTVPVSGAPPQATAGGAKAPSPTVHGDLSHNPRAAYAPGLKYNAPPPPAAPARPPNDPIAGMRQELANYNNRSLSQLVGARPPAHSSPAPPRPPLDQLARPGESLASFMKRVTPYLGPSYTAQQATDEFYAWQQEWGSGAHAAPGAGAPQTGTRNLMVPHYDQQHQKLTYDKAPAPTVEGNVAYYGPHYHDGAATYMASAPPDHEKNVTYLDGLRPVSNVGGVVKFNKDVGAPLDPSTTRFGELSDEARAGPQSMGDLTMPEERSGPPRVVTTDGGARVVASGPLAGAVLGFEEGARAAPTPTRPAIDGGEVQFGLQGVTPSDRSARPSADMPQLADAQGNVITIGSTVPHPGAHAAPQEMAQLYDWVPGAPAKPAGKKPGAPPPANPQPQPQSHRDLSTRERPPEPAGQAGQPAPGQQEKAPPLPSATPATEGHWEQSTVIRGITPSDAAARQRPDLAQLLDSQGNAITVGATLPHPGTHAAPQDVAQLTDAQGNVVRIGASPEPGAHAAQGMPQLYDWVPGAPAQPGTKQPGGPPANPQPQPPPVGDLATRERAPDPAAAAGQPAPGQPRLGVPDTPRSPAAPGHWEQSTVIQGVIPSDRAGRPSADMAQLLDAQGNEIDISFHRPAPGSFAAPESMPQLIWPDEGRKRRLSPEPGADEGVPPPQPAGLKQTHVQPAGVEEGANGQPGGPLGTVERPGTGNPNARPSEPPSQFTGPERPGWNDPKVASQADVSPEVTARELQARQSTVARAQAEERLQTQQEEEYRQALQRYEESQAAAARAEAARQDRTAQARAQQSAIDQWGNAISARIEKAAGVVSDAANVLTDLPAAYWETASSGAQRDALSGFLSEVPQAVGKAEDKVHDMVVNSGQALDNVAETARIVASGDTDKLAQAWEQGKVEVGQAASQWSREALGAADGGEKARAFGAHVSDVTVDQMAQAAVGEGVGKTLGVALEGAGKAGDALGGALRGGEEAEDVAGAGARLSGEAPASAVGSRTMPEAAADLGRSEADLRPVGLPSAEAGPREGLGQGGVRPALGDTPAREPAGFKPGETQKLEAFDPEATQKLPEFRTGKAPGLNQGRADWPALGPDDASTLPADRLAQVARQVNDADARLVPGTRVEVVRDARGEIVGMRSVTPGEAGGEVQRTFNPRPDRQPLNDLVEWRHAPGEMAPSVQQGPQCAPTALADAVRALGEENVTAQDVINAGRQAAAEERALAAREGRPPRFEGPDAEGRMTREARTAALDRLGFEVTETPFRTIEELQALAGQGEVVVSLNTRNGGAHAMRVVGVDPAPPSVRFAADPAQRTLGTVRLANTWESRIAGQEGAGQVGSINFEDFFQQTKSPGVQGDVEAHLQGDSGYAVTVRRKP